VEKQSVLHIVCVCVFITLGIQHAMRMRHTFFCCLTEGTLFFHIISLNGTILENNVTEYKSVF